MLTIEAVCVIHCICDWAHVYLYLNFFLYNYTFCYYGLKKIPELLEFFFTF